MTPILPDRLAPLVHRAGFFPERASSVAGEVDAVFGFMFWVSAFFFALIVLVATVFVLKYRRRPGRTEPEPSPDHSTKLELVWTIIPLALVMLMFAASTRAYFKMSEPGAGAPATVQVLARKWSWWFEHPSGKGARELHVVLNRPVELVMASQDVIHSLYVPEFRLKQDAVPGRYTRMFFTPTLAGTFPILCAEYCGTDHSRMLSSVVVHPDQASFDAWSQEGLAPKGGGLVATGQKLFEEKGCVGCHSTDGSDGVGPTVKGLFGKLEKLEGAKGDQRVKVDEAYVRESIVNPSAKLVDGFADLMPPTPLEEQELQAIIAYLKSIGAETP